MTVLVEIFALFVIMGVGFLLGKRALLDKASIHGLSNLVIKVALPSLILVSLQKPFTPELLGDALITLVAATVYYAGAIALGYLFVRLLRTPKKQVGALVFSLAFSNAGFVGFPVIVSILGQGSLFLAAIHNVLFNLLAFSVGIVIVSGSGGEKVRFPIAKLLNINVLAAIAGFILFLLSITLPPIIQVPLTLLGNTTTPLAMLVVGAILANVPARAVVGDWRLYVISAVRLLVLPAVAGFACYFAGVSRELLGITVIVAGMPAASNTTLLAELYGEDSETASSIVFLSTVFSIATIPIIALFLT
ncbi:MAG TPA: AEC family transporter [Treponema sp.]|nr:AEC family transporter [Treponema sp.]